MKHLFKHILQSKQNKKKSEFIENFGQSFDYAQPFKTNIILSGASYLNYFSISKKD